MATTYELIAKNVLGSDTATVTFSSIPGTYDDLLFVCSARSGRTNINRLDTAFIRFNGAVTDANLSARRLRGNGSSASSSSYAYLYAGSFVNSSATSNTFGSFEAYIPNYAGSSAKSLSITSIHENNETLAYIEVIAGLWDDTSAINEITIDLNSDDFVTGSSFFLYGITKA